MPYYAVGFGSWSEFLYRPATKEETQRWIQDNPEKECPNDLRVRSGHMSGCSAKTAGPFNTPKKAWEAATLLQKGASMGADFPFVFYSGQTLKLSTIANKIDCQEFICKKEYSGKHSIHQIQFIKDFTKDLCYVDNFTNQKIGFYPYKTRVPSSLIARKKLIKLEKQKHSNLT